MRSAPMQRRDIPPLTARCLSHTHSERALSTHGALRLSWSRVRLRRWKSGSLALSRTTAAAIKGAAEKG
jgi:hypothetical protein